MPTAARRWIRQRRTFWAILLAGGDGVRLDLTRRIAGDSRPKQFCRIIGGQSLFRQTRTRLDPLFMRDRQVFVLSRAHERYYGEDLTDAGDSSVIEQPLNRGTGIAISSHSFTSCSAIPMPWPPSSLVITFTHLAPQPATRVGGDVTAIELGHDFAPVKGCIRRSWIGYTLS
jgi:hypothetical protein